MGRGGVDSLAYLQASGDPILFVRDRFENRHEHNSGQWDTKGILQGTFEKIWEADPGRAFFSFLFLWMLFYQIIKKGASCGKSQHLKDSKTERCRQPGSLTLWTARCTIPITTYSFSITYGSIILTNRAWHWNSYISSWGLKDNKSWVLRGCN